MLIRDGARMLTCVEDMLEFFGKSISKKIKKTVALTPAEREIVQAFAVEEELSLDELAQKCNNSPGALAAQVTLMELNGILVRTQGSLYCLNKDNDYK
jgi:predicted Rossmann fold nucleotide-binding protein DprA/Smf involved in DNA uptake